MYGPGHQLLGLFYQDIQQTLDHEDHFCSLHRVFNRDDAFLEFGIRLPLGLAMTALCFSSSLRTEAWAKAVA
jgi:hypothetical protein